MKRQFSSSKFPLLFSAAVLMLIVLAAGSAPAQAQSASRGRLAYVGADDNIYLYDPADDESVPLTDDARQGRRQYQWPTWSSDGRLAFFSHEMISAGLRLNVFITPPDSLTPAVAYQGENEVFNYAYWSPANCASSPGCRDLAVLTAAAQGLSVLRVRDEAPDFSAETLGRGGPFYYSFSPDGAHMLWQRFGRQLDLFDTARGEIERLPDRVGQFQAPMWSPVDDRLLFAVINDRSQQDLVIADGDERRVIAADQPGMLGFAWSPDGQHVAYKLDRGELHVLSTETGRETAHSGSSQVIAFFWSPDGQHMAYLTLGRSGEAAPQARAVSGGKGELTGPFQQTDLPVFTWHVLDIASGEDRVYTRFLPSREMFYFVAFFDQFTQSHHLWSPDSRYLAYGELTDLDSGGRTVLNLLDVADPATPPREIAEGSIGIWSFE